MTSPVYTFKIWGIHLPLCLTLEPSGHKTRGQTNVPTGEIELFRDIVTLDLVRLNSNPVPLSSSEVLDITCISQVSRVWNYPRPEAQLGQGNIYRT